MPTSPYRFNYGEPGLFVEIYLPKKAVYQGALYDTLTEGFDLEAVKRHFTESDQDVRSFLKGNYEFRNFTKERVQQLSPSYEGYSLYELDGVFRSHSSQSRPDERVSQRGYQLFEERVQVIRLMFLPPIEHLADRGESQKELLLATRRYLRFWTHDLHEYQADLQNSRRSPAERQLAERLRIWLVLSQMNYDG